MVEGLGFLGFYGLGFRSNSHLFSVGVFPRLSLSPKGEAAKHPEDCRASLGFPGI